MNSPNRLSGEKSPYLLQHARNPVDWYPWGDEAFAEARGRDVPVFLSIGYSTCHWCHVMERESFEDPSIAALLNTSFVCIKVDREERPDIDRVYMTALQAMGQNGGWPMTMFLTPDRKPFYGGTYFPPESRYGRAGLPDVIRRIRQIWDTEREKAEESARSVTTYLEDVGNAGGPGDQPDAGILAVCYNQIASTYDAVHGGFGNGPKFPRPVVFDFLLRYAARTRRDKPLAMVKHTLRSMASGGMYDQIGGGFHRYSVDGEWRVPHFEKMLYDQAQLVQSYLNAFLCSREGGFATVARETLDYVLRDMTDPEGGFYSAEDADSPRPEQPEESGEGAFYVWEKKEIDAALGSDSALFSEYFGVEEGGNVPVDPQHEFTGRNILYRKAFPEESPRGSGIESDALFAGLAASGKILFDLRAHRPRPLRDDKILTAWNGLMIGAFARGGQVLGEPRYLSAASRAAEFVTSRMRDPKNGVLYRRYRGGEARIEGQLEDYAFLVSGLLDLFESSGEGRWLERAVLLTEEQIRIFHDSSRKGFFETSGNDGSLLVRIKEQYDGAEPSGNSVAAMNLTRLSRLIDRPEWETLAAETVATFSATLRTQPGVIPMMASALEFLLAPPRQIVIVGPADDRRTAGLTATVNARYLPTTAVIPLDPGERGEALRRLNRFLANLGMVDGEPTAYVCRNFVCELPVTEPEALAGLLDAAAISGKEAGDAGAGLPAPSF